MQSLANDHSFGARVIGITKEALDNEGIRVKLRRLLERRGIIVCKGIEQTSAMQVNLSRVFGQLKEHPVVRFPADRENLPGVIVIASRPKSCIVEIDGKLLVTWQPWHSTTLTTTS